MGLEFIGKWLDLFWDYLKCGFFVHHYEEAILLTNGKYSGTFGPGFHFKWPFYEYVYYQNIKPNTINIPPLPLTTKDNETIVLGMMIDYHIEPMQEVSGKQRRRGWRIMETGTKKFVLENNDSLSNLIDRSQGELSDLVEGLDWLVLQKKPTRSSLQSKLQAYAGDMGVIIDEVKFTGKSKSQVMHISGDNSAMTILKNNKST